MARLWRLLAALPFIMLLLAAPARAQALTAEVLQYGLVKDRQTGTKEAPNSPSGLSNIVDTYRFIRETLTIEACPGTVFGVEHRLSRKLRPGEEPVFLRYEYPRQITPDGRSFTTHDMPLEPGGREIYTGFTFEFPWEMVSGDWTFRLMQGNRTLSVTTFNVTVGPCMIS